MNRKDYLQERARLREMNRRAFLKKAGIISGSAISAGTLAGAAWQAIGMSRDTPATIRNKATLTHLQKVDPAFGSTTLDNGLKLPTAAWVSRENLRPGTSQWQVGGRQVPHAIEGFADRVSAVPGDTVTLFVNTTAQTFHVEAYRIGWYQGIGGRLVWQGPENPGKRQPPSTFTPGVNMVECHWAPSTKFDITSDWPPGVYLLKLVGNGGEQQFVPLTLRDPYSTAAYVVQNSVTTWQAYNLWGGYSLYYGANGHGQDFEHRARVVSFDRPYPNTWANGAADLLGNELPLIFHMEKLGLDVTYTTDVDLHTTADLLTRHRSFLSLGHDEYWSAAMRANATAARDSGVNLAFMGANAVFRRIRFESSPVGPNRRQVCYKDDSDPLYGVDNADITTNWPSAPDADPESSLIGNMYQSNPVDASLVVADPTTWLYLGTGAKTGDALPHVVGSEYDCYQPGQYSPSNVQIFAHSPLVCHGKSGFSDVTWYTAPSGAGVFASGSNWWISKLMDVPQVPPQLIPGPFPGVTKELLQITDNLLAAIGWGPSATGYASVPNWKTYYPHGATANIAAPPSA